MPFLAYGVEIRASASFIYKDGILMMQKKARRYSLRIIFVVPLIIVCLYLGKTEYLPFSFYIFIN